MSAYKIIIRRGQVYGRPVTFMLGDRVTIPNHPAEKAIAESFRVEIHDLHRHCRGKLVDDARVALYQLLSELGWKQREIGAFLNRDHACVTWGIKAGRDREETDREYREKLNAARKALRP